MQKKHIIFTLILSVSVALGIWGWHKFSSPTKIALVNFPNFQTAAIATSSPHRFIRVQEVSLDELQRLNRFDAILIFGMGIRMDEAQRQQIQKIADRGKPVFTFNATNPANDIHNQDSLVRQTVSTYMRYGTSLNYGNMLAYIRGEIQGKRFFAPQWSDPFTVPDNYLYHTREDMFLETLDEYEDYRRQEGLSMSGSKKIALTGGISGGRNRAHIVSLIDRLEEEGYIVYPIAGHTRRMEFLKAIEPDAVIYMPHGRLAPAADEAVEWLKSKNIPVFAPLTILETREKWMENPMGLSGGFLSQTIVMPELDGAILPYAVNAQYINEEGLHLFKAVPERLETFVRIVNNHLALRDLDNSQKRVAIYYFKGSGLGSLTAAGLEVVTSIYEVLKTLRAAGYNVEGLPASVDRFKDLIMTQGVILGPYAKGAWEEYLQTGNPEKVGVKDYLRWAEETLPPELYRNVVDTYGPAPGTYMAIREGEQEYIAVARVQFGNVVLLPQPMPGTGDDTFSLVHGANVAPPHSYIASYLWMQHGFAADAVMHFGTHGSLEFTPGKQVALSHNDWSDHLIGHVPHFYFYTINNVGEGIIARRRSYASLVTHLTPPFMDGDMRSEIREFSDRMRAWYNLQGDAKLEQALRVKEIAVEMGLHRDLRLDEDLSRPYTDEEMHHLDNFAGELTAAKVTGQMYTAGIPYEAERITSTVVAMSTDPIAYGIAAVDRHTGKIMQGDLENRGFFNARYLEPAQRLVLEILNNRRQVNQGMMQQLTGLNSQTLESANEWAHRQQPALTASPMGERRNNNQDAEITDQERDLYENINRLQNSLDNILKYREALLKSPELELQSILNAFSGGYVTPSPGGDPVANPNTLPTGRNMFAINAEATPSETAWDIGKGLAKATIEEYKRRNGGRYPRKVTYTLWGGEFIQTEGATIAQVFYMLGVEPVRDVFGRINDLRLIPSEDLGRPRIDVLVQTSGQLRDIAASRLFLVNRAVEMAAAARDDAFTNFVSQGVVEAERIMVNEGIPPARARQLASSRVFGGLNGMYGTGIIGLVESGDRWEEEAEIARTYLNNMGAMYSSEDDWGGFQQGVLRAVLHNADAVVQPRQSNTWGPLSLDHVYEFMGGINLTIRYVTGNEPDAFFSDYRNRHNPRVQEVKEAIGVEARTTVLNPAYIREQMKGRGSSAGQFAEIFRNTYGFNVMKPDAIDNELWDGYHEIYVQDRLNLGLHEFFKRESPAALQEMTAVMMETARKGYWDATPEQLAEIADLHTALVNEFRAACSGFVCDNMKLRDFIAQNATPENARQYNQQIARVRQSSTADPADGIVMTRETLMGERDFQTTLVNGLIVVLAGIIVLGGIVMLIKKRRNQYLTEED
jgi:cobaltochelatase CobN